MSSFTLDVSVPNGKVLEFTIDELKEKFEVIEMPVTLMCAGNRRAEFNAQVKDKKVNVRKHLILTVKDFKRVYHGTNVQSPPQDGKEFSSLIFWTIVESPTKNAEPKAWSICGLKDSTLVRMESEQELRSH